MKRIILATLIMLGIISCQKANEDFISLCKISGETVRVSYMDSFHGIVSINNSTKNDTLYLNILVGLHKPHKIIEINFEKGIQYINTGLKTVKLDELNVCQKIYSGEEGIEYMKSLRVK
ncbi:MAG: hypothetical protein WCR72_17315 [Bacteroidota bacterium]